MEKFTVLSSEAKCWDASSLESVGKRKKDTRKRRSGSMKDAILEGTLVEIVEHRLPENEWICKNCEQETGGIRAAWQFCVSLCHCSPCGAEVCDVLSSVPAGVGV